MTKQMPQQYKIRLKGHFNLAWATYIEGFEQESIKNGETVLTGEIADQTTLHGLLALIRDLGIPLLEIKQIQPEVSLIEIEKGSK